MPDDFTPDAAEEDAGPSSPELGEVLGIGEGPELYPQRTEPDPEDAQSEEEEQQATTDDGAPPAAEPAEEIQTEGAPEAFFEYNGKTFADAESAKQYFDSWNGRLAKANADNQDALDKNRQWQQAYESGALHEEFTKKLAGESPKKENYNLEEINWNYIKEKIEGGDAITAMQYLSYENGKYMKSEVEKVRAELSGALEAEVGPAKEVKQVQDYSIQLMLTAQQSEDVETGQANYPEFRDGESYDPAFVQTFSRIWKALPASIALSNTLEGVDLAYHRTHAIMANQEAVAKAAPRAPAGVPDANRAAAETRTRNAQGRYVANSEAASTAVGGSDSPDVSGRPNPEATFKAALAAVGTVRNDVLGISE